MSEPDPCFIVPPFTPISEGELQVANLHPKCIVENYLYADLALMAAAGGTGKTTLLIYEAICIALGQELWGLPVLNPGATLFITAEDSKELILAKFREIVEAMHLSPAARKHVRDQISVWDVSGQIIPLAQLNEAGNIELTPLADNLVAAHKNRGLAQVVFDPAISFGPGERLINDGEQAIVTACRRIIRGLHCVCRILSHTGKANARNGVIDQYASRGGSAFPDGSRMVTILSNARETPLTPPDDFDLHPHDSGFVLARAKLSYSPPQPNIWVRRRDFSYEYVIENPRSKIDLLEHDTKIVDSFIRHELQEGRKHSKNTLETALIRTTKLTRQRVRTARSLLETSGRIRSEVLPEEEKSKGKTGYLNPVDPHR